MPDDTRSSGEIERDIESERTGMRSTLDELQERFSAEGIAREVQTQFREHGSEIGRSVSHAVRENPVAVALTGIGIAWLMFGGRGRDDRDEYGYDVRRGAGFDPYRAPYDPQPGSSRYEAAGHEGYPETVGYRGYEPVHEDQDALRHERVSMRDPDWARTDDLDTHASPYGYYDPDEVLSDEVPEGAGTPGRGDEGQGPGERAKQAGQTARERASAGADRAREGADRARDRAREGAERARARASEAGSRVRGRAAEARAGMSRRTEEGRARAARLRARIASGTEDMSEEARARIVAARERAIAAREEMARRAGRGRDGAVDFFEDHPLVVGALALAAGAAIGGALPRSRYEDEYLGEHSDWLMDEAERIYEEEREKARHVARAAADEARDVAEEKRDKADETAPGGKSAAEAAADEAKDAARRVGEKAGEEARKENLGKPRGGKG